MSNVDLAYRQLKSDFRSLEHTLVQRYGISLEEARKVIACTAQETLIWYAADRVKTQAEAETPSAGIVISNARGSSARGSDN